MLESMEEDLEKIWTLREGNMDDMVDKIENKRLRKLQENNLIEIKNKKVFFTPIGEEIAKKIVRRHRLAERLLCDVLEVGKEEIENSACKFEHVLSKGVEESICTLLGHPVECPHGMPIPKGECCLKSKRSIESIIHPLTELNIGDIGTVVYILSKKHPRLHKLMSFGIVPSAKIKIHQKFPSYVIQIEETQIAMDEDIVKDIYVKKV